VLSLISESAIKKAEQQNLIYNDLLIDTMAAGQIQAFALISRKPRVQRGIDFSNPVTFGHLKHALKFLFTRIKKRR
jgi:hypothetical protein